MIWSGWGLAAGLIVRALWPHALVSLLFSLLFFLLFAGSVAFFAMADSRIVDPERLRTRQWLPLAIVAFLLGIRVHSLWGAHRPLALLLLVLPIPVVLWLAAVVDMRHNRLE